MFWSPNFFASPSAHFNYIFAVAPGRKNISFKVSIAISPSVTLLKVTKAQPLWLVF